MRTPNNAATSEGGQDVGGPLRPLGKEGEKTTREVEDGRKGDNEEGSKPGEGAMSEIDHRCRLEDDHEAHGQKGVDGPETDSADEHLCKGIAIRRCLRQNDETGDHDRYMSSIKPPNIEVIEVRFSF